MELKIIKMNKNTKKYIVRSNSDDNQVIELESNTLEDAAIEALAELGWAIKQTKRFVEADKDQFQFNF
jgi:Holliday junction resolvasome RuvABC DNA-binding subunit